MVLLLFLFVVLHSNYSLLLAVHKQKIRPEHGHSGLLRLCLRRSNEQWFDYFPARLGVVLLHLHCHSTTTTTLPASTMTTTATECDCHCHCYCCHDCYLLPPPLPLLLLLQPPPLLRLLPLFFPHCYSATYNNHTDTTTSPTATSTTTFPLARS